jgi:hypothetical protein
MQLLVWLLFDHQQTGGHDRSLGERVQVFQRGGTCSPTVAGAGPGRRPSTRNPREPDRARMPIPSTASTLLSLLTHKPGQY